MDKRGIVEYPNSLLNPNFRFDANLIFSSEYSAPNIKVLGYFVLKGFTAILVSISNPE